MTREDAKDLTLSILVVVVALLVADNIYLHCKCATQGDALRDEIAALNERVELHINPPPGPTMKERAKKAYAKAKRAVKCGYASLKERLADQPEE